MEWAGKGSFALPRSPSIVTPQLLDGVLIQRLAGSRFAESLVRATLSFYPPPDTLSLRARRKSPATEGPAARGQIIIIDDHLAISFGVHRVSPPRDVLLARIQSRVLGR